MRLFYILVLAFLALFDSSCTHDVNIQVPYVTVQKHQVSGKIILPADTKIDTIGLEVLTAVSGVTPVNSAYVIDTSGKTSTTLLINKAGDVVLMGYNYPGQRDSNLSAESTALTLLMNTLTLRSLSEAGKLEAIGKIKADPNYKTLANEISGSLTAGKAITDTTNTKLITALSSLFKHSTGLRVTETSDNSEPIIITKANTTLLLQNNRVAHTYEAGVYKDDKPVGLKYVIGGRTLFATSLTEAAQGVFGDGYGIPEPVLITLPSDGEYQLRIRSGKPGEDDGSIESKMARSHNVHPFLMGILKEIVPFPDGCNVAVMQAIPAMITSLIQKREIALSNASSSNVFGAIAFDITGEALGSAEDIFENCGGDSETIKFLKGMGRTFSLIVMATKVMAGANITAHVYDLFHAVSAINTCYQVKELKTYACGEDLNYLIQIVSGNTQKGEFGKPLANSLVVKMTDKGGKAVDKADVIWTVNTGEGSLSTLKSITNAQGLAEVKWTLGAKALTQEVTASVNEDDKVKKAAFSATAIPGVPTKVEIVSGNNQSAEPAKAVSAPLIIKVTDQFGNPVLKVQVDWQVKQGGGSFLFTNNTTNDEGTASANWILGQSGGQAVDVVVKNKDGNYLAGAPLRFIASVGETKLSDLILGKWKLVRESGKKCYGVMNPFFDKVMTDEQYYLEFRKIGNQGTGTNDPRYHYDLTWGFRYQINEEKSLITFSNAPPVEVNADVFKILELNNQKFIYRRESYGGEDGYIIREYQRVTEKCRTLSSRQIPYKSNC